MSGRQWEMLWPWADPSPSGQALTPLYQAPKHSTVWSSTSQSCMTDRVLWFEVTQEPMTTTQDPVTTLQVQPHLPQLHWLFPLPSREISDSLTPHGRPVIACLGTMLQPERIVLG